MESVDCLGRMEMMLCQAERDRGSISGWWEGRNESSKAWGVGGGQCCCWLWRSAKVTQAEGGASPIVMGVGLKCQVQGCPLSYR